MSSSFNFCRLCLQKFTGPFKILNEDPKAWEMVKNLFPGMDLSLVQTSKICTECFKYIQFSYTMRETAIKNEQKINSNMASVQAIEENTCRLCLNTDFTEATVLLYENINQLMPYLEARSIIEIAIVNIRFEIFKRPVVCNSCWQIVRSLYLFKKKCFATEKIFKFYCTKNNISVLTDKEVEIVSNCYYSNLQKFSKGKTYDLRNDLVLNAPSAISNSVDSLIKPVDVYLNNFTTDDEDDIFEEDVDDIFVETPRGFKREPVDEQEFEVKKEGLNQSEVSNGWCGNVDGINIETCRVKNESQRSCKQNSREINHDVEMAEISVEKRNTQKSKNLEITTKETVSLVKETNGTVISSNRKDLSSSIKTGFQGIEICEKNDKEFKKVKPTKNFESIVKETESMHKESHKETEKSVNKLVGSSNLGNNPDFVDNHKETFEPMVKKRKQPQKTKKKLKDMNGSANVEKNNQEFEENEVPSKYQNALKTGAKEPGKYEKSAVIEWSCDVCEFKTKYKQHLNRHRLVHNKNAELLTCSKCVYSTHIQRNLDRHILTHTTENSLHYLRMYSTINKCHLKRDISICQEYITKEKDLQNECATDSSIEGKKPLAFRCQECPYVTSREEQMIAHLRTHNSKERILKCTECYYITTRTHSLRDHMELHDQNLSKKNFKCDECSFTAKRHTHLVSHMLKHQNQYKFNCSECSYKAKRKSHLVTHMLRHQSDEKKAMFQCPYCKYKSMRREHLRLHCQNKHYDKAEVNCNEVAQVAIENDEHGSHAGKKTVTCPYCSYRNQSNSVRIHIFTVHFPSGSDQMKCNNCSYETDNRKRFLSHINTHHNKDKTN